VVAVKLVRAKILLVIVIISTMQAAAAAVGAAVAATVDVIVSQPLEPALPPVTLLLMAARVLQHVVVTREGAGAARVRTLEGTLASVLPGVTLQVLAATELLRAHLANMAQSR